MTERTLVQRLAERWRASGTREEDELLEEFHRAGIWLEDEARQETRVGNYYTPDTIPSVGAGDLVCFVMMVADDRQA